MKKLNVRALMVLTLFIASTIAMPAMVFAQDDDDDSSGDDQVGIYKNFSGGFGAAFGDQGYGGQLLASVFEMLLLQGLDLKNTEMTPGVFVLSAEKEEKFDGTYTFNESNENNYELHILDDSYTDIIASDPDDMVYVEVERTGAFDFNLTIGAAITLLIWDNDESFITAAQKLIDFASNMNEETDGGKKDPSEETIAEGISVLTWLLIHINDIFTGDELFVLNPITWQQLSVRPWNTNDGDVENMTITKTPRYSDDTILFDIDDRDLTTGTSSESEGLNFAATLRGDSYVEWLTTDLDVADIVETIWTQFSFDLAQLWVKNFHIEIDVGELAKGADANMGDAFSGLDIEFFLFTHHLGGAFLYNDTNSDETISVTYEDYTYWDEDLEENVTVELPTQNEITHQLILGEVEDFDFSEPKIKDGDVKWGLRINNAEVTPVPVGVDLNNYLKAKNDILDWIEFGCVFQTEISDTPNDDGSVDASGRVKLAHNFAPWNGGAGPNTDLGNGNTGLDMAIVYISSIFHFHLQVDNEKKDTDPEDSEYIEDYEKTDEEVKVGNYLDPDSKDKLNFVDLASDPYQLSMDVDDDEVPDDDTDIVPSTTIIPVALWTGTGEAHKNNVGNEDSETDDFTTDAKVEASFGIMLYGVCYSEFNGSGKGIWHDPTFTVYMVFTPESAGFWALILLVAGVGLVGIATILIKRRKDNRF